MPIHQIIGLISTLFVALPMSSALIYALLFSAAPRTTRHKITGADHE